MAGGNFLTENKKLPGAYINFKSVPQAKSQIGSRGIAAMTATLSWGPEGSVIELFSTDLEDGKSLAKVGVTAFDSDSLLLRECLKHCYKLLLWRINTGGVKAQATLGNLEVTAKYSGTKGNDIKISIIKNESKWDVKTFFKTDIVDAQTVLNISDIKSNDFVEFGGTGVLAANAGVILEGGTNGTVVSSNYAAFLNDMKTKNYNCMGIPTSDASIAPIISNYIKDQRDRVGKKVQAVVYNYNAADHEGIISSKQGYKTTIEEIDPVTFVAWITGATAAAEVNEDLCYKIIEGAESIIGDMPEDELEKALEQGWFLLSKRVDGKIVVLDDINTFVSVKPEKGEGFISNKTIRVFDEIGNTTRLIFEKMYIGGNNGTIDRMSFKAQLIANFRELEKIAAIENFAPEDITVEKGKTKSNVRVSGYIEPMGTMKKLYMIIYER